VLSDFFSNLPAFVLVLGVLIFIHELGHFLAAKMCGVGVVKFAIGFGPAIAKFSRGETMYQVGIIPLGGYVRMVGDLPDVITGEQETDEEVREAMESPELSDRSRWFIEKPVWQKAWIVFAGPLFNFILAIFLAALSIFIYGEEVPVQEPIIGVVVQGSPASKAGIQAGDRVVRLGQEAITSWHKLATEIHKGSSGESSSGSGGVIALAVEREGEQLTFNIVPQLKELPMLDGSTKKVFLIGIRQEMERTEATIFHALWVGVAWTGNISYRIVEQLGAMVIGERSAEDLAGPIFIFNAAGQQAKKGLESLFSFIALLSVSLGVLNLLPIPVLDGGHLAFFLLEGLFGPISIKKKESAQQIGVMLLVSLMLFAVWNDLTRNPDDLSSELTFEEQEADGKEKNSGSGMETSDSK